MVRPLALSLALSLSFAAAPATGAQADAKADPKKKKQAPAKKPAAKAAEPAEPDPLQEFLSAPSPPPPTPEPKNPQPPRPEPRTETRSVEAAPVDDGPPKDEKPSTELVAPPPPAAPETPWYGRTVGHAGAYFQLGFGLNWWTLDRTNVTRQVTLQRPEVDTSWFFDASVPTGGQAAGTVRGGYNVLGHAHLGFNFLATGWNVFTPDRGGGGYVGGELGWHPLSLVSALLPQGPLPYEKFYDFWLEGGAGYGIVGKHHAMDGLVGSFGLGVAGYPAGWVSIGIRTTWYFPVFESYILNYDYRSQPGNTIALPEKSGGSVFQFAGYLEFHFGTPGS